MKPAPLTSPSRLGRVSNLPTVWTNVLAGIALAGGASTADSVLPLGLAVSLFYVGGHVPERRVRSRSWDAHHRPERPIPAGQVRAATVFGAGFGMLRSAGWSSSRPAHRPGRRGSRRLALVGLIVLYDVSHKENPLSPS